MQPIPLDHPYAWCSECGERLPEELQSRLPRLRKISEEAAADRASMEIELREPKPREADEPVEIKDRPLRCVICRYDRFFRRVTRLSPLFHGYRINAIAVCYVCGECGYVHWFIPKNATAQD